MSLKKTNISLAETGQFSRLMLDYINGSDALNSFYSYKPEIKAFQQAIEDKSKENINRSILVKVLKEQYSNISSAELQQKKIELLLDKNTFTVCTGHQLCLFTGPLYFIYKIISTINLSETLKRNFPQYNFVPVYWMASEDHDFEEVQSINLFGKKLTWINPEAKGAVGSLNTTSINSVIDELKQILGESENAAQLIQLYSDAYLNHETLAEATRYLVHQLFSEFGLVIIDGNDGRLKAEFTDIIKDDICNNTNQDLVSQTISELEKLEVKAQVNPRPINCFYMINNLRERIEYVPGSANEEGLFKILNTSISFTKNTLLDELKEHPERFSPNVVLRPLFQQKILPNLAYIGGPGEIAYWLEYKRMFDYHKISFPVLMPRNFALLTDEKTNQQIQKLGFTIADLFKDAEVLIKEFVNKNAGSELSMKEQEEKLSDLFLEISAKATAVDITLKGSVEAELQKVLNGLKNIESKLIRSEKQKQETSINQIKKLKDKFFPEGALQERHDTLAPYYLKSGKQLIQDLKNVFDPLEFELNILTS
ncbi:MAG: bacillithiol biosynthesis cysteine-adding enzyme BshC [Bacteroidota bacterium]